MPGDKKNSWWLLLLHDQQANRTFFIGDNIMLLRIEGKLKLDQSLLPGNALKDTQAEFSSVAAAVFAITP